MKTPNRLKPPSPCYWPRLPPYESYRTASLTNLRLKERSK